VSRIRIYLNFAITKKSFQPEIKQKEKGPKIVGLLLFFLQGSGYQKHKINIGGKMNG